jgi:hypothetical protein
MRITPTPKEGFCRDSTIPRSATRFWNMENPTRNILVAIAGCPLNKRLPSQLRTGTAAAAAFAIINSIGNISGFLGLYLRTLLGTQRMLFLAAAAALIAVVLTLLAPIPKIPAEAPDSQPATI